MESILNFITQNQNLLIIWSIIIAYCGHRLINYMAAKPQQDGWDNVKPYSDALYKLVFEGVEAYAKKYPMSSAAKAQTYLLKLSEFEKAWNNDKLKAVKELAAWYFAMKEKDGTELENPSEK